MLVAFLLVAGALNAADGVSASLVSADPTPLLRGLVHLGVAGLMSTLACLDAAASAVPFAILGLGLAIAATRHHFFAWQVLVLWFAEVAFAFPVLNAPSLLAATGLALSLPGTADASLLVPAIFHRAFLATLCTFSTDRPTCVLSAFLQAVLSWTLWRLGQGGWLLLLAAAGYAAHAAAQPRHARGLAEGVEPVEDVAFRPAWAFELASGLYAACLVTELALVPKAWGSVELQTAVVHVTAILASLVGFVPAIAAFGRCGRWMLAAMPLLDAAIAVWRYVALWRHVVLPVHAALALVLGAAMVCLPVHRSPTRCAASDFDAWGANKADAGALAFFALVHAAAVVSQPVFEDAVHLAFHTLVVALGLSGVALLTRDCLVRRVALVLTAGQAIGEMVEAFLVSGVMAGTALRAVAAAVLCLRIWRVPSSGSARFPLFQPRF